MGFNLTENLYFSSKILSFNNCFLFLRFFITSAYAYTVVTIFFCSCIQWYFGNLNHNLPPKRVRVTENSRYRKMFIKLNLEQKYSSRYRGSSYRSSTVQQNHNKVNCFKVNSELLLNLFQCVKTNKSKIKLPVNNFISILIGLAYCLAIHTLTAFSLAKKNRPYVFIFSNLKTVTLYRVWTFPLCKS